MKMALKKFGRPCIRAKMLFHAYTILIKSHDYIGKDEGNG